VSSPTYTAMIKLWRLVTEDVLRNVDSLPAGSELFQRGSMELVPGAPVLVDHDKARPIGFIKEIFNHPDTDGEWLCALTTITDPPAWLKRGTAASISYATATRGSLGEAQRILRGLVTEVSVLSPGVRPAEPRARVLREASNAPRPCGGRRIGLPSAD
jgi:hypothetical protein